MTRNITLKIQLKFCGTSWSQALMHLRRYGFVGKTNRKGTTIVFPFEGCRKKFMRFFFYNVFSDVIFYPRILQYFGVSKTIPALAYLVTLTIQHSCYSAQTFEVCGPKLYQSENKFFLYIYLLLIQLTFSGLKQLIPDQTKQNRYQTVPFSLYIHNLMFVFILE